MRNIGKIEMHKNFQVQLTFALRSLSMMIHSVGLKVSLSLSNNRITVGSRNTK